MTPLGFPIPLAQLRGHQPIEELANFDGPVLAHYMEGTKHFLYYWSDADEITNRWMVIPVQADQYRAFVERRVPLIELIRSAEGGYVMMLDLDNALRKQGLSLLTAATIPHKYLPDPEYYYSGKPKSMLEKSQSFFIPKTAPIFKARNFYPIAISTRANARSFSTFALN